MVGKMAEKSSKYLRTPPQPPAVQSQSHHEPISAAAQPAARQMLLKSQAKEKPENKRYPVHDSA